MSRSPRRNDGRDEAIETAGSLILARVVASDGERSVVVELAGPERARVVATVDECVHAAIVSGALARKERVLVTRESSGENSGFVVVGALRTAPIPGIDEADEYVIRAGRVRIEAAHEFSVASGLASIAVRAYGHVETLADQITSRASSIHKVIGRMLHLN